MEAKLVFHHDDPPCEARLTLTGMCPDCRFNPDMQSLAIWYYCPLCDIKLKNMTCPVCKQAYERPH